VLRIHSGDTFRDEVIENDKRDWTSPPWTQIQDSVPHVQQHFVNCLRSGEQFETSAQDSLQIYALAEAAYRSAASGTFFSIHDLDEDNSRDDAK
jgi:predicted dehydrogenase